MKVSISAILRKFKFGIPFYLRNYFFRLLGEFGYHGNTKSFILSATVEHYCVCRSFMIFLNWLLGKNGFHGNKMENQYLSLPKVYKVRILSTSLHKINFLFPFSNKNVKYA